jgi:hypothetical protein
MILSSEMMARHTITHLDKEITLIIAIGTYELSVTSFHICITECCDRYFRQFFTCSVLFHFCPLSDVCVDVNYQLL